MSALDLKLWRELWRLRGQMLSISLVVAAGVMTVVTLRGTYESLLEARDRYYRDYRFAEVWSGLERAPEHVAATIARVPGVATVQTRVTFGAILDIPTLDAPAQGLFVSVPDRQGASLNDLHLREGRYVSAGGRDEVVVGSRFANANGFAPGDTIEAILNGRLTALEIVGIAISPEFTYVIAPGSLFPDDERYGVLWMNREVLGPVYDMDGAFNEVLLTLAPGANESAVIQEVDRILEPWGGLGAYGRDRQLSHRTITDELRQNRSSGTVVPAIFLGVAAFLLNLVLGRLISTQRTEIAVLKAFGYRDGEVGRHYLLFALFPVAVGAVIGTGVGAWLGSGMVRLYGEYFDFPVLEFALSWRLVAIAVAVSALAAWIGAAAAVRGAVRLPPAEGMRPEPPAQYREGPLERNPLGRRLPSSVRMILRNIERRPVRSLLASVGVAFAAAILVLGLVMFDAIDRMTTLQFRVAQREDLTVSFQDARPARVRFELARLDGVQAVELFRFVPVRLESGHRSRTVGISGVDPGARLRRIVSADGRIHPVPGEGLLMSGFLAEELGVGVGDLVRAHVLEGSRPVHEVPVVGIVDDFLGLGVWMDLPALARLSGGGDVVSGAHLQVRGDRMDALFGTLKRLPTVAAVASPAAMLRTFEAQLEESLLISVTFMLGFASLIAIGIVYNGARIALSERGRELASLRVLGFTRREVAMLLFGEQALLTLIGIPLGWGIGYGLAALMFQAFSNESYRIPMVVSMGTYLWSSAGVLAAAAASGWIVRRRLDRLDLIAVLKTRE